MDGKSTTKKEQNGQSQFSDEQMDVTSYMFTKNGQGSELNSSKDSCEESFEVTFYSPFSNQSGSKEHPVEENSLLSRIGPFADNRPICECDMVKQMTANPDVRYLLSLLPDMAEMNPEQKSVFKTRVLNLLHKTLMVES